MREFAIVMREEMRKVLPDIKAKMDENYAKEKDNIDLAFINLKLNTCINLLDYLIADDDSKTLEEMTNEFLDKLFK